MANVNVKQIDALNDLNKALCDYSQSVQTNLESVQNEINSTIEWIAQRERFWQDRCQSLTVQLAQAKRAYQACLAQPRDRNSPPPNCSRFEAEVRKIEGELSKAQQELNNVRLWKGRINTKVSYYMSSANRVRTLVNTTLNRASTFLRGKSKDLGDYAAAKMEVPSQISAFGNHGTAFQRAKQEMLIRALDDPLVSRDIKGWIRNELRRINNLERAIEEGQNVQHPHANSIRMPYGLDAGHRIPGVDTAANLRFEDIYVNRSRYHRALQLGIADRIR